MTNDNNTHGDLRLRKAGNPRYALDWNRPVKVYRNLNSRCFSIAQDDLVKAHADSIALDDVEWRVGEKGRLRVIREQAKNVHAYAVGLIADSFRASRAERVHYNPYRDERFNIERDGTRYMLRRSAAAYFDAAKGVALAALEEGGEA
jgi:hypothetical protein